MAVDRRRRAIDPERREPEGLGPTASQQFDETKPMRARRQTQPVDGELIDARARLVDAGGIDRSTPSRSGVETGLRAPAARASRACRSTGSSADAAQAPQASPRRRDTARGVRYAAERRARAAASRSIASADSAKSSACSVTAAKSDRATVGAVIRLPSHVYSSCFARHSCDSAGPRPGASSSARRRYRMDVEQSAVRIEDEGFDIERSVGIGHGLRRKFPASLPLDCASPSAPRPKK